MTEQEARQKKCPFMVDYTYEAGGRNYTEQLKCKATDCMAWYQYRGDGWCMRIIQGHGVPRDDT